MSVVLEAQPVTQQRPVEREPDRLTVAANWTRYENFLHARGTDYRTLRLTYDRGQLEFMSISSTHDKIRYLLGRMVDTLTEELDIPLVGQGETTIRRHDLDRGFEPDAWYYIQNAAQMQNLGRELNFETDPPPDLAIEVEISRSLLDRIGIYAAIGVREIWRCDGTNVRILLLQDNREYVEAAINMAIPNCTAIDLSRIVEEASRENPTSYFRGLREWIRLHLAT